MDFEVARNFLIALLIGAFVGIEREKRRIVQPSHYFGGIRTFMLLALLGATSGWLARVLAMPWLLVATVTVVGAALVASHLRQSARRGEVPSLTSEFAALAVCLLGAMVVLGEPALGVALGVVVSAVLAFKQPLHGLVERIGEDELYAGLKLLIASFIVLPLLPDRSIDPWGALNPYKVWLMVVLISALSLVGYVTMRWFGATQGTAITGIAGGLTSSTATTLSFARSADGAKDGVGMAHTLSAGILLAWLTMFARMLVIVAVVNPALLASTWLPIAAMGAVTAGFALLHYRAGRASAAADALALRNPFSLTSAIRFGAVFAVVLLAVKIAQQQMPGVGSYVVAALGGSVDVDAITLSLAGNAGEGAVGGHVGKALAIAALSNTMVKCGLVWVLAKGPLRRQISLATAVIVGVGIALVVWT